MIGELLYSKKTPCFKTLFFYSIIFGQSELSRKKNQQYKNKKR